MFSKEFMTFLVKYAEEENVKNEKETTREIEFKDNLFRKLAYVTVTVKK